MDTNKVEIITIGDEILIGQILDTNSAWIAAELDKVGFEIEQITSVHDNENHIIDGLNLALKHANIVLLTGGIGPTNDDITKQTLCKFFNTRLVFNQSVYQNIETIFRRRNLFINELTKQQALVPENCTVIQNAIGTAPITLFEKDNHVVISLPGVPNEMKNVMTNQIIPLLRQKFHTEAIIHKTLLVQGYSESGLAMKIADWENSLPDNIHLAYLPIPGITKLRLSGKSNNHTELELSINQYISSLEKILGNAIISYEDTPLEKIVGNILRQKEKTLATAESCTGGYIAHRITSIPGSSEYFKGTIVAYSNTIKTTILQVAETDLVNYGAVSKEVVEQMAKNVQNLLQSDYAIATSGVAGPDGGTENKPVGTIWISVCSATNMLTRKFNFSNDRIYNIERTTQTALLMLKEIL